MKLNRHGLISCFVFFLTACGPSEASEASIRLAVLYDETWGLDQLEMNVEGKGESRRVGVVPELLIWTKDEWVGEILGIEVVGLRAGERVASGRVMVPSPYRPARPNDSGASNVTVPPRGGGKDHRST